jgi:hypothetical protein
VQYYSGRLNEASQTIEKIIGHKRITEDIRAAEGSESYYNSLVTKCHLLITDQKWEEAENVGNMIVAHTAGQSLNTKGLGLLIVVKARLGILLYGVQRRQLAPLPLKEMQSFSDAYDEALLVLKAAETASNIAYGYIARAIYEVNVGDWVAARAGLAEAEEIATRGPMAPVLADIALVRARASLYQLNGFAPLSDRQGPNVSKGTPDIERPTEQSIDSQLSIAEKIIENSGYRLREVEVREFREVLVGGRDIASLPPRV